jgi:phosphinothricin acetyltransferase
MPEYSTSPTPLSISIAELADLPAIVSIYNQAVPTHRSTANITPVTVKGRRTWFLEHEPNKHLIFIAKVDDQIVGWCSLSMYRPGRMALRFTAEISGYVDNAYQHQGVGRTLIHHALEACPSLRIKNLVAVIIDRNDDYRRLLEKMGFQEWGHLPRVLDFDGQEFGEYYYGKRIFD